MNLENLRINKTILNNFIKKNFKKIYKNLWKTSLYKHW
jgi:hypothetical protein